MAIYDFACPCGEITEARAGYETSSLLCPACGNSAKRVAVYAYQSTITESGGNSYPRLDNAKSPSGKYRVSDFQEASAEIDYAASRVEQREGKPVKTPSAYKAGLRKAEKMGAKIRRRT